MFKTKFKIGNRFIGEENPCFIVAEAGVSHFGCLEKAFRLIDAAIQAKVDAVKFQFYKTEEMISRENDEWFTRMKSKELNLEDISKLKNYSKKKNLLFFATAHDLKSLNELHQLNVPCFKIGSGEIKNTEFYRKAASFGRPVIISTGMFLKEDCSGIMEVFSKAGLEELSILHCVTEYPTSPENANLKMIQTLKDIFPGPVGYSDHTATPDIAAAAVSLGAKIIEKHITLEKNIPDAQDWKVSCTPEEMVDFVKTVRRLEKAMGDGQFRLTKGEKNSLLWARKSIVALKDIEKGERITKDDITFKRPGTGISPDKVDEIVGRKSVVPIKTDAIITKNMVL